jgi:hypothetical protein
LQINSFLAIGIVTFAAVLHGGHRQFGFVADRESMFMMTSFTSFTVKLSLLAVPLTLTLRPSNDRLPLASGSS